MAMVVIDTCLLAIGKETLALGGATTLADLQAILECVSRLWNTGTSNKENVAQEWVNLPNSLPVGKAWLI
jgi:hypothetical protein